MSLLQIITEAMQGDNMPLTQKVGLGCYEQGYQQIWEPLEREENDVSC